MQEERRMPDFKMIPVHKAIHKRVKSIAAENHRTLGGQVAYWANSECAHPVEARQPAEITYSLPADMTVNGQHNLRGYFCKDCQRFVLTDFAADAVPA